MLVPVRVASRLLIASAWLIGFWVCADAAWAREGEITGIAVNEVGRPVAGATIKAQPGEDEPLPGTVVPTVASAKTDAAGRFRLAQLEVGTRYLVQLVGDGASIGHASRSVAWNPKEPEPELVLAARKGTHLRGRIRFPKGNVQAYVMASSDAWEQRYLGYEGPRLDIGWRTAWVACTAEGAFRLPRVPRGAFKLSCVARGLGEMTVWASHSPRALELDFQVQGGASLYGQVLGPRGPVAAATLRVTSRPDDVRHESHVASATTDSEGRYEVRGLRAGRVESIAVEARGFVQGMNGPLFWSSMLLRPGKRIQADVRVHAASLVAGVVRSKSGATLAGVHVTAYLEGDGHWQSEERKTSTNEAGRYQFESLPPCRGQVRPHLEGYVWNKRTPDPPSRAAYYDGGGTCFVLGKGGSRATLDFSLDPVAASPLRRALRGRAVDEKGNPLAGVTVMLQPNRWASNERTPYPQPVVTDKAGRFRFPGVSTDRGWSIHGESEDMTAAPPVWDVRLGTDRVYVLKMRRKSRTAGRVLDENGRPVAGVDVEVTTIPSGFWKGQWGRKFVMRAKTDAEGSFVFREADVGVDPALTVHGWRIQHVDTRKAMFGETLAGKNVTLRDDIVLRVRRVSSLKLEGRVLNADGTPAQWAILCFSVLNRSGRQRHTRPAPGVLARESWSAITDDTGWFRIWRASGDAGAAAFHCEDLVASQAVLRPGVQDAPLRLKPREESPTKHEIQGTLVDPEGAPVALAWLSADDVTQIRVVGGKFRASVTLHEYERSWSCLRPLDKEGRPREDTSTHSSIRHKANALEVRLVLERAEQRRGRIVDVKGNPMAGVVVDAYARNPTWHGGPDAGEALEHWTITDPDGRFHIGRIEGSGIVVRVFPQWPGSVVRELTSTREDTPILVTLDHKPGK